MNSHPEIFKYGNLLLQKFLPLGFSKIKMSEESKFSILQSPKKRDNSTRNSNYINFHGSEFEERKANSKSSKLLTLI